LENTNISGVHVVSEPPDASGTAALLPYCYTGVIICYAAG